MMMRCRFFRGVSCVFRQQRPLFLVVANGQLGVLSVGFLELVVESENLLHQLADARSEFLELLDDGGCAGLELLRGTELADFLFEFFVFVFQR